MEGRPPCRPDWDIARWHSTLRATLRASAQPTPPSRQVNFRKNANLVISHLGLQGPSVGR